MKQTVRKGNSNLRRSKASVVYAVDMVKTERLHRNWYYEKWNKRQAHGFVKKSDEKFL